MCDLDFFVVVLFFTHKVIVLWKTLQIGMNKGRLLCILALLGNRTALPLLWRVPPKSQRAALHLRWASCSFRDSSSLPLFCSCAALTFTELCHILWLQISEFHCWYSKPVSSAFLLRRMSLFYSSRWSVLKICLIFYPHIQCTIQKLPCPSILLF